MITLITFLESTKCRRAFSPLNFPETRTKGNSSIAALDRESICKQITINLIAHIRKLDQLGVTVPGCVNIYNI